MGLLGKWLPCPPKRASQTHPPSLPGPGREATAQGAAVPSWATRGRQSQVDAAPHLPGERPLTPQALTD